MNETRRVYKAAGWQLFWRSMWARAYPRIIGVTRERSWLLFETLLPLMATCAYIFFYRAINAPEEYTGFAVIGGAMTAFWLNVLWSMASQLYWDKDAGNLELYVVSPAPLMAILLGMAVGGIIMTASRAVLILVACTLFFNVTYTIGSLPMLVLIFITTMAALYGLGMVFAGVYLVAGRSAWHMSNLLQEPIYLASGLYFPVKALGIAVATIASVIPLTLGLDAMRQLLFTGDPSLGFLSVEAELALLIVLSVVLIGAAYLILNRLEAIGRREGRLIERRR